MQDDEESDLLQENTVETLVSNLQLPGSPFVLAVTSLGFYATNAQRFTTGNNHAGYDISTVQILAN